MIEFTSIYEPSEDFLDTELSFDIFIFFCPVLKGTFKSSTKSSHYSTSLDKIDCLTSLFKLLLALDPNDELIPDFLLPYFDKPFLLYLIIDYSIMFPYYSLSVLLNVFFILSISNGLVWLFPCIGYDAPLR